MITPQYCQMMARYNAWQNDGLRKIVAELSPAELTKDRGAFFGSIMATLNHLLWGDSLWMSRFDGGDGPSVASQDHTKMTPTPAVWAADRFRMDARITLWAEGVSTIDLTGDLIWRSAIVDREFVQPKARCLVHMFNHQTHHRGQVHAMLTSLGIKPNDTDLPFLPE